MVTWDNLDTLASFQNLSKTGRIDLKKVMSGENGAERVKITVFQWQRDWCTTMLQSRWMMMCWQLW